MDVIDLELEGDEVVALRAPLGRGEAFDALSPAEREVADAVLRGDSNRTIAAARATSVRTVANQLASIYRKLGVRGRTELAARVGEA